VHSDLDDSVWSDFYEFDIAAVGLDGGADEVDDFSNPFIQ